MIPGIDPKLMKQAMKRLGIKEESIDAFEVIIKTRDKDLIIKDPSVSKVVMAGQETFQITGEVEEQERGVEVTEDDIKTVMEQAGCSKEEARSAIERNKGDLAKAILDLS